MTAQDDAKEALEKAVQFARYLKTSRIKLLDCDRHVITLYDALAALQSAAQPAQGSEPNCHGCTIPNCPCVYGGKRALTGQSVDVEALTFEKALDGFGDFECEAYSRGISVEDEDIEKFRLFFDYLNQRGLLRENK